MTQIEKMEFKTELKQLLHLITHSLYSNKEIFLRELLSNSGDAINKIRFNSLEHEDVLEENKDWKIRLVLDKDGKTLTISDNGIGMSHDSIIENLGTIARSGTKAFLEQLQGEEGKTRPNLIGQFGVGFYSAFMVADRVDVRSRGPGKPEDGVLWSSDGQGEYTLVSSAKETRGTEVILHLKNEEMEFLDPFRIRTIVRKFSDFVEHPIVLEIANEKKEEGKEEEVLNSRKALWLRSKNEVTPEEHDSFYRQISNDFEKPLKVIHYAAEGTYEFRVLLYLPATLPMEFQFGEVKFGPRLYIQRVLIMEHCEELLPSYLRFARGVVECPDLPLNISREILQQNPVLEKIRKDLASSVLKTLKELMEEDLEKYRGFFQEMGSILKEGLRGDFDNKEKIAALLLFSSLNTPATQQISLQQYVQAMPEGQGEILFLAGESRELVENSPLLEIHREEKRDVLLLTESIDEFTLPWLNEFKGKKLKAVDRLDPEASDKGILEETKSRFNPFLKYLGETLSGISSARLTGRLKDSPMALVSQGMSATQERFLKRIGKGAPEIDSKRVLEINPRHPLVNQLRDIFEEKNDDPRLAQVSSTLYDLALLAEGSRPKDLGEFMKRVQESLKKML
ncbi:MAG: molecular chaperone HtpG [Gemmataceae bacterium]|nr:molecular chaperone HtpG [Gemmataceae bacterium]